MGEYSLPFKAKVEGEVLRLAPLPRGYAHDKSKKKPGARPG
jgi:hypothetical protein